MLGEKNSITLWERCRRPQRGGVQRCCSHDHPVTWKQMSHCHYGTGWKHVGVLDFGWSTANTSSLFPETKVQFSVWLKKQKRREGVTKHFYFLSSFQPHVSRVEPWMAQEPLGSSAWQRQGRNLCHRMAFCNSHLQAALPPDPPC